MIITDLETLRNKSIDYDYKEHLLDQIIGLLNKELIESKIKGVGLSGIQIGIPIKICIIRTEKLFLNLYNTKIISGSEPIVFKGEGCLSIPNKFVDTLRMNKIIIRNGDGKEYKLEGFNAVVVQHEIDHWNSILITDRRI